MMLLDLSRHTVRRNIAPYVGSFAALFLGVTLIGLTVEMITAVAKATARLEPGDTKTRLQLDDLEAVADAATAGLGLAWLPEWLVRERLLTGALVSVLDDQPGAAMDCHALWPAAPHMPLRLRLAVDALVEQLPKVLGVPAEVG